MTLTAYAAKVTFLIDDRIEDFSFPESFESDVEACFLRRMSPEDAAEHLLATWAAGRPAEREYRIAYATTNGEWDVVKTFRATDNAAANAYAEEHYSGDEWYVLDDAGRNINGGHDQA
jgi:hypothetical protein